MGAVHTTPGISIIGGMFVSSAGVCETNERLAPQGSLQYVRRCLQYDCIQETR